MSTTNPHILVYPVPGSGHVIPLIDFTRLLLNRGLTVTFAITPDNLSLLDPLLHSFSSSLKTLLLPEYPEPHFHKRLMLYREGHAPILHQYLNSQPSLLAILSDFFLGWTNHLASQHGLPRVVFSPSGGFALSMYFTLWKNLPKPTDPTDLNSLVTFPDFPNCPSLHWYQIPQLYRNLKEGDPDWEFQRQIAISNIGSWGIVFNTSSCLEQVYLDRVKKQVGHDRVWAVGPLDSAVDRGGASSLPCHDVISWLDARAENSVVYVAFGSRVMLTDEQMEVLAAALDKSGVYFVWCVKEKNLKNYAGIFSRGYIVRGWAPQVTILRHKAVGAFLTHCGWNSTLEGIGAGVVMLTWPMGAEQFVNAQLLVQQLGVGMSAGESDQKIPESDTLASLLVDGLDTTRPQHRRAKELRRMLLSAVEEGGSSTRDFNDFVGTLFELKKST